MTNTPLTNTPLPEPIIADALQAPNVRHGFFTRVGGVSQGIYAGLNCGVGSDDDRAAVRANRDRVAETLLGKPAAVLTCHQIHSADVVVVDGPFDGPAPKADALVTRTPGIVLGALAADCAPVLLADPQAGVVAAAHAGWRGALAGVVDAAVIAMEGLGAKRDAINVVVGPCIAQASYEVGLEFEAAFTAEAPASAKFFMPGARPDKRQFDLPGYLVWRTSTLGLASVAATGHDVYPDADRFFSYRRSQHRSEPDYGRLISAIALA